MKITKATRWRVFAGVWIQSLFTSATAFFSLFSLPMCNQFGWSSSDFSMAYTIYMFIYCAVGFLGGILAEKLQPRVAIYIGLILFAGGWILTGFADSIPFLYIAYGVIAGAGAGTIYPACLPTALKWFPDKSGSISGLVQAGAACGPFIMSPIAQMLIDNFGAQQACVILGIVFLIGVGAVAWMIVPCPDGWTPEGWVPTQTQSKELNTSIPTITKLLSELMEDGFIEDLGKQGTSGGRKPNIYGLCSSAGYLLGADIRRHHINLAVTDFKGNIIAYLEDIPFVLESSEESFRKLCVLLLSQVEKLGIDKEKVLAYGINLTGRVNHDTGICFSYFIGDERPLDQTLEEFLGKAVYIDNDSRAMAYGEYICGVGNGEKNMLFINLSWGLGMGIIINGRIYMGKSGFSGEIGHIQAFDNEVICHCGKKGCLETGASGSALHRIFIERIRNGESSILSKRVQEMNTPLTLDEIIRAINKEDPLGIEIVEEIGQRLGKHIAGLINIFNPEMVIIGGTLALTEDYILQPIKTAVRKYSLNMVNKDSVIVTSKLKEKAGVVGACMLARSRTFEY